MCCLLASMTGAGCISFTVEQQPEPAMQSENCAVCVDDLVMPERLSCGHTFCAECVTLALADQRARGVPETCPMCRAPVIDDYRTTVLSKRMSEQTAPLVVVDLDFASMTARTEFPSGDRRGTTRSFTTATLPSVLVHIFGPREPIMFTRTSPVRRHTEFMSFSNTANAESLKSNCAVFGPPGRTARQTSLLALQLEVCGVYLYTNSDSPTFGVPISASACFG
jgi:hypothetical protein